MLCPFIMNMVSGRHRGRSLHFAIEQVLEEGDSMICNGAITLWHMEPDDAAMCEGWRRIDIEQATVYGGEKGGILGSGMTAAADMVIRIPTHAAIDIAVGDKLILGQSEDAVPSNKAWTVTAVFDNRRGSANVRHYKVCARG